jgi:hypothetical protein
MNRKNWLSMMALLLVTFAFSAFNYPAQVTGNGNVVKEERKVSDFKAVTVNNGINLLLSQGSAEKVVVEADENVIPYIKTEVSGGVLRIGIKGNINNTGRINVYVTAKTVNALETGSGASLKTEGKIQSGDLKISYSSGSSVKAEIACTNLEVTASSGSSGVISGSATSVTADGSSGSALVASDLRAEKGDISASSGSAVVVQVTKELKANASSGGNITVTGNPSVRNTDSSSGGSVHFK